MKLGAGGDTPGHGELTAHPPDAGTKQPVDAAAGVVVGDAEGVEGLGAAVEQGLTAGEVTGAEVLQGG